MENETVITHLVTSEQIVLQAMNLKSAEMYISKNKQFDSSFHIFYR